MNEFLFSPWPWWFSGILIGLTVPALFLLSGKAFGISTSLQQMGAMCSPRSELDYLKNHDPREGLWTVVLVVGILIGSFIATFLFSNRPIEFLPDHYRNVWGGIRLLVGGVMVGFGARYAGGCTSGHSITGIAHMSFSSMVATAFFLLGGLAVTWGLGSLILSGGAN
jgi:uncharacterized protein